MRQVRQTCMVMMLFIILLAGCGTQTGAYLETSGVSTEQAVGATQEMPVATQADAPILVYICGAVKSPGVYELAGGSRICDAVEAAGGLTDEASREYWNLAELLSDGEMLYFPTVEEAEERQESGAESTGASVDDGRININTADADQLMQIPGVGESRAEAILSYRRENGSFSCIEDIMKVSGIKNALFEKMKDYITT